MINDGDIMLKQNQFKAKDLYETALLYYRAGNFLEIYKLLKKDISNYPTKTSLNFIYGIACVHTQHYKTAVKYLTVTENNLLFNKTPTIHILLVYLYKIYAYAGIKSKKKIDLYMDKYIQDLSQSLAESTYEKQIIILFEAFYIAHQLSLDAYYNLSNTLSQQVLRLLPENKFYEIKVGLYDTIAKNYYKTGNFSESRNAVKSAIIYIVKSHSYKQLSDSFIFITQTFLAEKDEKNALKALSVSEKFLNKFNQDYHKLYIKLILAGRDDLLSRYKDAQEFFDKDLVDNIKAIGSLWNL